MKMTKKQAAKYIEDRKNWKMTQAGIYVHVYRLDFGQVHFAEVQHKHVINTIEVILRKAEPRADYGRSEYYVFNEELDCFGDTIRRTAMADMIWEEAKKL